MGAVEPADSRHEITIPAGSERAGSPTAPPRRSAVDRWAAYRASGDQTLRNRIVEDHRWLALHCARRFARKGEPLDDLVQVATLGLIKAVDRFDPGHGVMFTTYAVPTISGELRRHFRDRTWSMHVPRRGKDLYQALSGVADDLTQTLQRSPTITEMAHRAGTTVEEALAGLELRDVYRGVPLTTTDEEAQRGDAAILGRDDAGYEAAEARETVRQLIESLPTERDRLVVRLRFIDELSQWQIATRVGVSQVQVSRLLRTNLERMRRTLSRERR